MSRDEECPTKERLCCTLDKTWAGVISERGETHVPFSPDVLAEGKDGNECVFVGENGHEQLHRD